MFSENPHDSVVFVTDDTLDMCESTNNARKYCAVLSLSPVDRQVYTVSNFVYISHEIIVLQSDGNNTRLQVAFPGNPHTHDSVVCVIDDTLDMCESTNNTDKY